MRRGGSTRAAGQPGRGGEAGTGGQARTGGASAVTRAFSNLASLDHQTGTAVRPTRPSDGSWRCAATRRVINVLCACGPGSAVGWLPGCVPVPAAIFSRRTSTIARAPIADCASVANFRVSGEIPHNHASGRVGGSAVPGTWTARNVASRACGGAPDRPGPSPDQVRASRFLSRSKPADVRPAPPHGYGAERPGRLARTPAVLREPEPASLLGHRRHLHLRPLLRAWPIAGCSDNRRDPRSADRAPK
ncbi:PE-PGRS family protein [Pseudofrankia inefficax]|uniref:PE-PGRS family protein n=1 Tax=Pseudofrankia inefficax (strain DSM 45817 / CECT 9037 / DDB 130130 / EuI1c) TaxID=298654 RepID=E3ITL9_PSEI1|nr:PE-PGRS family protein [Pseudofrankia inefficax]